MTLIRRNVGGMAVASDVGVVNRALTVNVLESLDYTVELGELTLPAIAIDGSLVFPSWPTPAQLRWELLRRRGHA